MISAKILLKGVESMAMKYTEEQLNSLDKSMLVQLFLAMQEESEKQTRKLEEMDEKLIAIPFGDPQYNEYKDISELPSHIMEELTHFLSVYKQLENKKVEILFTGGAGDAKKTIEESMKYFEKNIK